MRTKIKINADDLKGKSFDNSGNITLDVDINEYRITEMPSDSKIEEIAESRDLFPKERDLSDWGSGEILEHLKCSNNNKPIALLSTDTQSEKTAIVNSICDFLGVSHHTNLKTIINLFKERLV